MKINLEKIIPSIIIAVAIILSVVIVKVEIEKYLIVKAINECSQTSTVTYTNPEGAKITEPYKPSFDNCLRLKGYEPK